LGRIPEREAVEQVPSALTARALGEPILTMLGRNVRDRSEPCRLEADRGVES